MESCRATPLTALSIAIALILAPAATESRAEDGSGVSIDARSGETRSIVIRSDGACDPRFERRTTIDVQHHGDYVEVVRSDELHRRDFLRQRPREHPRRHHREYRPFRGVYDDACERGEVHLHLHF